MPVSFCWHVLRLCKHLIFHILLRWWHCAEQTYQITFLVLHQTKSASTYTAACLGISTSSVKVHLGNLVLWACCWTCPSSVIDCWLFSLKHVLTDFDHVCSTVANTYTPCTSCGPICTSCGWHSCYSSWLPPLERLLRKYTKHAYEAAAMAVPPMYHVKFEPSRVWLELRLPWWRDGTTALRSAAMSSVICCILQHHSGP